jgi:vesicular inhibitory amino acid transporter
LSYAEAATPNDDHLDKSRVSKRSFISVADNENVHLGEPEEEAAECRGANPFKYVILRIAIVAILVVASVVLKDHFADLSDFVGASQCTPSFCRSSFL